MFGAVLLMLSAEECRDNSVEDQVWPAVIHVLKADTGDFNALFAGGHPSAACKKAIAAGARRLKLRNTIDLEGTQQYFDTVKLQFGFTFKGAIRKLPDWLDGLGIPLAVKILTGDEVDYGDLKSSSFSKLWKTLGDFRRSRVTEAHAGSVLNNSPWVRPGWTAELLQVSRRKATGVLLPSAEAAEDASNPLCEARLRWNDPARPELILRLNNEERVFELLGDADKAVFKVDGQVVGRWLAQADGGWHGPRELPCQRDGVKPNLRPELLSIDCSGSQGNRIEEIDLSELEMCEPLLVFDLKNGVGVDPASRLDRRRDYALICDSDLKIFNAGQPRQFGRRSVYRLMGPWDQEIRVECSGSLYWQAKTDDKEAVQPIRLTLEFPPGEPTEIGTATTMRVSGVPEDVTALDLIGSSYSMKRYGAHWQTDRPVKVTLDMALGRERLRVRVRGRAVTPKLALNLRGIACIDTNSREADADWATCNRERPLNCCGGLGQARIFADTTSRPQLYEGNSLIKKITSKALPLSELSGWGSPLIVHSQGNPDFSLVQSVEDYGRGRFLPSLFGGQTNAMIRWRVATEPTDHKVFVWSDLTQPPWTLGRGGMSSRSDGLVWDLPGLGVVAAMAIAFQGERIASFWSEEAGVRALQRSPTAVLFGLLRWLKVPVLNPSFRQPVSVAVAKAPADFVRGWMGVESLPFALVHQPAQQGIDSVMREFLWNYSQRDEAKMNALARAFPAPASPGEPQSEAATFKSSLANLSEACPSLAYRLATNKLQGDKYAKYVRAVVATMLHQPEGTELPQIRTALAEACRDCSRLLEIGPDTLTARVGAWADHLDGKQSNYSQTETDLRRLGETSRGRPFLSAALLLRLLERRRF